MRKACQVNIALERKTILQENLANFNRNKANFSANEVYAAEYAAKAPMFWFDPNYDCMPMWKKINTNGVMVKHFFNNPIAFADYDNREALQDLAVPTFLALGRYDYAVPYTSWDFAKAIKNLTISLFMKSAHYPMPEEQQLFDQKVIEWIKTTGLAPSI